MIWKFFPMEAQGIQHTLPGLSAGDKAALFSDAKSRQPKTGTGNTSQVPLIGVSDIASVPDNAGIRIGLLPKIAEIRSLQFLEKSVVLIGKGHWRFRRRFPR